MSADPHCSILLIDDDPLVRRSIAVYLEDNGYQVRQADNGWQALELFDQQQPDLVLTDLMMPGMDGLAVVKAVQERAKNLPVIVISGNGSVKYAIETMRQGAWDYITKPIHDFEQLDRVIGQSLHRAQQACETQNRQLELALHSVDLAEQLAQMKHQDPLTGLPQRQQMQNFFYQNVVRPDFSGLLHLVLLDLDNLKSINKSLGLNYGDALLQEMAQRFKSLISDQLWVSRLGGDQFMLLVCDSNDLHSLVATLQRLLADPVELAGQQLTLTAGIGIASYPQDGESLDRLLQNANIAMARAKQMGKNCYCLYQSELGSQASQRFTLESQLQYALQRNEFHLHYQPKLEAASGKLTGMEALLRWSRIQNGTIIGPDRFVPVLEEIGLITDVGRWVLATACQQYVDWRRQGMPALTLSINVSAVQFHQSHFLQTVIDILAATGMDPGCLCLELTENIFINEIDEIEETLQQFTALGVQLSIDDFGTGYSSLSYLLRKPVSELKVDRTFVRHLPDDKHAAAIINSVIGLAQTLGIKVVAEGVEHQEQAEYLIRQGCHELQGYLFSRPLDPAAFATYAGLNKTSS